jgi:hypothetical protein
MATPHVPNYTILTLAAARRQLTRLQKTHNSSSRKIFATIKLLAENLEWEPMESRQGSRLATYFPGTIDSSAADLERIHKNIVDRLFRLKKAVGPRLKSSARQVSIAQTIGSS